MGVPHSRTEYPLTKALWTLPGIGDFLKEERIQDIRVDQRVGELEPCQQLEHPDVLLDLPERARAQPGHPAIRARGRHGPDGSHRLGIPLHVAVRYRLPLYDGRRVVQRSATRTETKSMDSIRRSNTSTSMCRGSRRAWC